MRFKKLWYAEHLSFENAASERGNSGRNQILAERGRSPEEARGADLQLWVQLLFVSIRLQGTPIASPSSRPIS